MCITLGSEAVVFRTLIMQRGRSRGTLLGCIDFECLIIVPWVPPGFSVHINLSVELCRSSLEKTQPVLPLMFSAVNFFILLSLSI